MQLTKNESERPGFLRSHMEEGIQSLGEFAVKSALFKPLLSSPGSSQDGEKQICDGVFTLLIRNSMDSHLLTRIHWEPQYLNRKT